MTWYKAAKTWLLWLAGWDPSPGAPWYKVNMARSFWFVIGAASVAILFVVLQMTPETPYDLTKNEPERKLTRLARAFFGTAWLSEAHVTRANQFIVATPFDPSKASALLIPLKSSQRPQILITDKDEDGNLDRIIILDAQGRNFLLTDKDGDGAFDEFTYAPAMPGDAPRYTDLDMDGQYDTRFAPDPSDNQPDLAIFIAGEWRGLVSGEKKGLYVKINGRRRKLVRQESGDWKLAEPHQGNPE